MTGTATLQKNIQAADSRRIVNERALLVLPALVALLVPGGYIDGDEYIVRNPRRQDKRSGSFKLNVVTGQWLDFACSNAKGPDPLSFVQYCKDFKSADEAADLIQRTLETADEGFLAAKVRVYQQNRDWTPISPIPAAAGDFMTLDLVSKVCPDGLVEKITYRYDNATGERLFYVVRYQTPDDVAEYDKQDRPFVYAKHNNTGLLGWRCMAPRSPRPLYNLPILAARPEAHALVVEGEKTAEAAAALFPDYVVTTSPNGSGGARKADWSPLKGRAVVIWPDNDQPGAGYAKDVADLARAAGAVSVRIVKLPSGLPEKWDLADEPPEDLDRRSLLEGASSRETEADNQQDTEHMDDGSNVRELKLVDRNDPRPVIRLGANVKATVDKAEKALIDSGRGLYQRNNLIVCVDQANIIATDGRKVEAQLIRERGDYALIEDLSIAANFEKFDKRKKEWVSVTPPMEVVKTLKQRQGRLKLPVLSGVINAPTLRQDGTLLDAPGYDPTTGLLFDPGSCHFWDVANITRNAAEAALATLQDLIQTFPFVSQADESVALATIMTAVVRRSLPTAPLFGFSAPTPGSGKSKLVDIASVIASGRVAGVLAMGKTDEETEKRLASALLDGRGIIAVDNCEAPLGGDMLCQLLTQGTVLIRPLGKSETVELQTGALVTATGNALAVYGDMTRRAVICRLDAKVERPELRTFKNDPVKDAMTQRGLYVTAVLAILRAYIAEGKPRQVSPLGSFEAWSDLVRSALIWLGCADPVDTMEYARMGDPVASARYSVMAQWRKNIRDRVTVGQVITAAGEIGELHDALLQVAGLSNKINNVRLGKWLAKNIDLIVTVREEGQGPVKCSFREAGTVSGNKMWQLTEEPA